MQQEQVEQNHVALASLKFRMVKCAQWHVRPDTIPVPQPLCAQLEIWRPSLAKQMCHAVLPLSPMQQAQVEPSHVALASPPSPMVMSVQCSVQLDTTPAYRRRHAHMATWTLSLAKQMCHAQLAPSQTVGQEELNHAALESPQFPTVPIVMLHVLLGLTLFQ